MNQDYTIENAIVKSTFLGYEGHHLLTCYLHCRKEAGTQSFGGWNLVAPGEAQRWITGILSTLSVPKWEDLPHTVLRIAVSEREGRIEKIGHAVEDRWFSADESNDWEKADA